MLNQPKILLVEDDNDLREILEENLQELGCECVAAKDGLEALDLLRNNDYTSIISDIRMPNMDGMDMLKTMRNEGINTPVIFITGYSEYSEEMIDSAGGVTVIHKPFSFEQITEIVEGYIELLDIA